MIWALYLLWLSSLMPTVSAAPNQGKISSSVIGLFFLFTMSNVHKAKPSKGRAVGIHNSYPHWTASMSMTAISRGAAECLVKLKICLY